jgi:hypothetical protein
MAVAVAHIINDMKAMVNAMILHMMIVVYIGLMNAKISDRKMK